MFPRRLFLAVLACCIAGCGTESTWQPERSAVPTVQPVDHPSSSDAAGGDTAPDTAGAKDNAAGRAPGVSPFRRKRYEPVDHTLLKELLPESVVGLTRTRWSSAESRARPHRPSAFARYEQVERKLEISIEDSFDMIPSWIVQRLWDEATGPEIAGFPAEQAIKDAGQGGTLRIYVGNRFTVHVRGENVATSELLKALQSLDLTALAALHQEPAEEE